MGISLAVGRLTLDQVAEVRILHPQPPNQELGIYGFSGARFAHGRIHVKSRPR